MYCPFLQKCNKCEARFDSTDDLQDHMNNAHGTAISKSHLRNIQCDKCEYRGIHRRDIFVHNVRVHNSCVKCNMNNFEKEEILTHLAVVHDEKVKCNSCDFRSFPPERVSKHIRMIHNKCSDCFQQFNNPQELDLHMNTMHKKAMVGLKEAKAKGPSVVKCDYCDYTGPKGSVKMHMSRIHKGDLRYKYFCEFCDFKTYMKTKIVDHAERRQKHDSLSYCDIEGCEFKSCTWFGLVFHKARTHGVTKHAKRFKCGYCDKTFTLHNNFSNHVRKQHQGEKGKFSCTLCDFKTFDKFYLKKHISNHTEKDFPYQRSVGSQPQNSVEVFEQNPISVLVPESTSFIAPASHVIQRSESPQHDPLMDIKNEFDFNPEKMITLKWECTTDDVDVD